MAKVARIRNVVVGDATRQPEAVQGYEGQVAVARNALQTVAGGDSVGRARVVEEKGQPRGIVELRGGVEGAGLVAGAGREREPGPLGDLVQLGRVDLQLCVI